MTKKTTEQISFECTFLAKYTPNNCRVEVIATCISDDPKNPKMVMSRCTHEKECGVLGEGIPPGSMYFKPENCYVAKNPHKFLYEFKD